jgi:hypothetical protein
VTRAFVLLGDPRTALIDYSFSSTSLENVPLIDAAYNIVHVRVDEA